jgi:hypothetical protein
MNTRKSILMVLFSLVLAGTAEAQEGTMAQDPFVGTWKLNVERSVWYPGPRSPDRYELRQFTSLGDGWYRFVLSGANALGSPTFQMGAFRLDGRPYPVHNLVSLGAMLTRGGDTNVTRSYRVLDENRIEYTTYTNGVAGNPVIREISPDGTAHITISQGTNADGEDYSVVLFFDRVN